LDLRCHIKETIKLALPISAGQLGHIMLGVIDSAMVGKVGSTSLAAASLVNGIFFLVLVLGIGLTMASTPLIAMAKGAGKFTDCGKTLNHSLIVNLFFSVFLTIATYSISFLLPSLNQPEEVVRQAVPYLRVLSLSIIPFILFQCYRQFLEGLSLPNPPMVIAILANISHAFLNWIFIYGNLGSNAYGLFGAGVATAFTRWTMALVLIAFVLKYKKVRDFKPEMKFIPLDFSLIKKLVRIGLPSGLQYFLEVSSFTFAAVMIGWIGKAPLASHQIALNIASITYMVILGISFAGTIRVGTAFGLRSIPEIRKSGFTAIGLAAFTMLCFGIIIISTRNYLPLLYIKEKEVIELASKLLIIAALFQLFDGLQASGISVLRGLADTKIPMIISLGAYWIIGIPVAALLGFYFKLGAVGIWIGLLLGLAILGISMLIRFNKKSRDIFQLN
jgi:MATE family multidrug resistance protein